MDKLYIIGGSGFIGKNMVRCLYGKFNISVFDKYIDEEFFADYPNVQLFQMELDKDMIASELDSPDFIINLASV